MRRASHPRLVRARNTARARSKLDGKIPGQVAHSIDRLNSRSTPVLRIRWSVLATGRPTVAMSACGDRSPLKRGPELREESENLIEKQGVTQP